MANKPVRKKIGKIAFSLFSPDQIKKISAAMSDHPIYALDADLETRGIKRIIKGIEIVNYDGFVELVEEHEVAPWL